MSQVLVTGGTGYVGMTAVDLLAMSPIFRKVGVRVGVGE
jgi:NADPH:quinone reductase-like Zn-dependent oxidoreductase